MMVCFLCIFLLIIFEILSWGLVSTYQYGGGSQEGYKEYIYLGHRLVAKRAVTQ